MPTTAADIFGAPEAQLIEVTIPGAPQPILLRQPTFKEWHEIVTETRRCGAEKVDPPASLIAKTIAVCVADAKGKRRLTDHEATALMDANPSQVMELYSQVWKLVLEEKTDPIAQEAKNSKASRK